MEKYNERESYFVDIEKILGPKLRKKLPRFVINFLKRRLHQDVLAICKLCRSEH